MKIKQIHVGQELSREAKSRLARREERGVALLLTIFGLLLLTAVAMAMMFSSDTETMVAVNYRDKDAASYAAFSGLQEARERLQPVTGDLASILTSTPTTSSPQVLYIINPANGEPVRPWDPANKYFDTELCQENALGLTGYAYGVSCPTSAIPSGGPGSWFQVYDNSANTTPWKLSSPLNYKWVRITLKQNGNTPAYVDPSAATNAQVCWDGVYQDIMPTTYTSCSAPTGNSVIGVNLISGGTLYTSAPTVQFSGGGGSGASATAVIAPAPTDAVSSVTITNGGSGYTAPPTVTITGSNTTATFTAVTASAAVTGVTISNSGTNYCYASGVTPTVNFSTSPLGQNANATATMSASSCVASVSSTSKCTNTTAGRNYTVTSLAGGSGFAGKVTFAASHKASGISISQVGTGYTSGSKTLTIVDDSGAQCSLTGTVTTGYQLSSVALSSGGAYITQPTVTLGGSVAAPTSQQPTLPALTARPNPWPANASAVTAIQITSGGSGYTPGQNYTLTITPSNGVGSGATAYATATGSYVVTGFANITGGTGYTTPPTVTISGGGGSGAAGTATIGSGGITTSMGKVYLVTSMAVTQSGTKSMAQMEVGVRPPFNLSLGGAITLPGPEPVNACMPWSSRTSSSTCLFPNSSQFNVSGVDANTCGGTPAPTKPAIGVYDNQSQTNVINSINPLRYTNYTGVNGSTNPPQPSVEQVYAALGGGSLTPAALDNFVQDIWTTPGTTQLTGNITSLPATTLSSVTVVDGDLSLSGSPTGNGILVVTGTLTLSGDFNWNGLVLVIGQGAVHHNGGGNMFIDGAMYAAQTVSPGDPTATPPIPPGDPITGSGTLASMGTPSFQWTGGGTNQISYDHCKADALLKNYQNHPSSYPLQILSERTLQF